MNRHFIVVSLCIRNEKGIETGKVDAIRIGSEDTFDLAHNYNGNKFQFIGKYQMKIGRKQVSILTHHTCGATWCFEDIILMKEDLASLLNYLKKDDNWGYLEGPTELCDKWEDDSYQFNKEDFKETK